MTVVFVQIMSNMHASQLLKSQINVILSALYVLHNLHLVDDIEPFMILRRCLILFVDMKNILMLYKYLGESQPFIQISLKYLTVQNKDHFDISW